MWVVRFENVTKRHRGIASRNLSVRGDVARTLKSLVKPRTVTPGAPAIDDLSFSIEQGSAVALVGANGAGKSTALRLMSRIIYPTSGRVRVRGRVGALLEVGSGVHPDLSGRENVWLYGSIIGIPRAEIRRRFDEIVEFAELSTAIDRQAKFYSSGMQLRLGFAIATFLEPQTLLVDESLATADLNFQLRCIDRLATLVRHGTTLLLVSHEVAAVESLCTRALLLEKGRLVHDADTRATLAEYRRRLADQRQGTVATLGGAAGRVVHAGCLDDEGQAATQIRTGGSVTIELILECPEHVEPVLELSVTDGRTGDLIVCNSADDGLRLEAGHRSHVVTCRLESLPLTSRSYRVWAGLSDRQAQRSEAVWSEIAAFRVVDPKGRDDESLSGLSRGGPVEVAHRWSAVST